MSMLTELNTMLAWLGIALVIYGWYLFSEYLLDFTNYEIRTVWDSTFWTIFYVLLALIQYQYIYISLGYEPKSLFELFCCQCKIFYWGYSNIDYDLIALDAAAQHNLNIFRKEMFGNKKRKKTKRLQQKQTMIDNKLFHNNNDDEQSLLHNDANQSMFNDDAKIDDHDDESSSDDVESIESLEDTQELLDIANGKFTAGKQPEMSLKYLLTFRSGVAIFLDFLKNEGREFDLLYMIEYSQFIEMRYSYLVKKQENQEFDKINIPYLIDSWIPRNDDYNELTMKEHALVIYDKFIKKKCKYPLRISDSNQKICHSQFAKLKTQLQSALQASKEKSKQNKKRAKNDMLGLFDVDLIIGNSANNEAKNESNQIGFGIMGVDYASILEGVMKDVWKEMNDSFARFISNYDPKGFHIALKKEDNAQGEFFLLKIQAFYYA